MHDASSSTTPYSLGNPPSPTAWSSGSSSSMLTPAMMASRVSAFCRVIMSYARATPRMPLPEATTTGRPANSEALEPYKVASETSARALRLSVTPAAAATPTPTNFRLEIDTLVPPRKLNSSQPQSLALPASVLWMPVAASESVRRAYQSLYIFTVILPSLATQARYIPSVLNGVAMFPFRSMAMTPPPPFCATSSFITTSSAACRSETPLYRTRAQMSAATLLRMKNSPSPVPDTAQLRLLA